MNEILKDIGLDITKYKEFFKILPTPIYVWKKFQNDFLLKDLNNAAEKITEGKIKEIEGTKASVFFKEREAVLKDLHYCFDQKAPLSREMKYTMVSSGQEKNFNVNYFYVSPSKGSNFIVFIPEVMQNN